MTSTPSPDDTTIQIDGNLLPEKKLPCDKLLLGSREDYIKIGVPLYRASIKGDWKVAEPILHTQKTLTRSAITEGYDTPLHIAASAKGGKHVESFVKNLVEMMNEEDLELKNDDNNTAFSLAAAAGNVKTATIMVEKNPALLDIPGYLGVMPLLSAASMGNHAMARYLYKKSNKMGGSSWTSEQRGWVLQKCVENDIFDVALKIANDLPDLPELLKENSVAHDLLLALAPKTKTFQRVKWPITWKIIKLYHEHIRWDKRPAKMDYQALQLLKIFWNEIAKMSKDKIIEIIRGPLGEVRKKNEDGTITITKKFNSQVLFVAAKSANARFIIELIRLYPDLIWQLNDNERTIFHIAVKRRHANIYNILHEIGAMSGFITAGEDKNGNNMLHLLGKSATKIKTPDMSGVALQLQKDLLWYKEVEKMIPPAIRGKKNHYGETPYELFQTTHKEHITQGEKWMKETASQCMVVAALIATIVFGVPFTIPSGYDQNTGVPNFKNVAFMIFVISDAVSLIFSSTSVLLFVSILTSIYGDGAFLVSLPRKLMLGLGTLFLSVLSMMICFSASFFALYRNNLKWLPIMVTGLASIPVILFAMLQFPFLVYVFYSTYRSSNLFQHNTRKLYK